MSTGDLWPSREAAAARVLEIQAKLHQRAGDDHERRFDDLYNLVGDPAFLLVGWHRVRGNKGARTAGVDGHVARAIEQSKDGVVGFLKGLRDDLKSRSFRPLPVRQRMIPKANGKLRALGIPTVADRVVQATLKLVLEPIFEADFHPNSYGFRPGRRAQDAIEEIRDYAHRGYEWVFEGDIASCFDEIDHVALMGRLRRRIGDKRVLSLVKSFLKAGLLGEAGISRETRTGTPQGGILSPLLANIALSVLDDELASKLEGAARNYERQKRRRHGLANYRLVRYADDFVILAFGTREQAEELHERVAATLDTVGLKLAPDKTRVVHIDEGFDFLGFRIKRDRQRGSNRRLIYTYPSKKAVADLRRQVKQITRQGRNGTLADLLKRLNLTLRGWAMYFRHGSSWDTFSYLSSYVWLRVHLWMHKKHPGRAWRWLRRRYYPGERWRPEDEGTRFYRLTDTKIARYRYRGAKIPVPWPKPGTIPVQGTLPV